MTKETYIKITQPFRDNPEMAKGIHILNKAFTMLMYVSYPCLLIYLFFSQYADWVRATLVPAISFVLLTLIRKGINRRRPYEAFGISSAIPKKTKGNSFPSRHVFSATIIAMTFLFMSPWMWLGVVFLIVTVGLAIIRVVSGVHYPSDVVAGVLCGIFAACVGYLLL